MFHLGRGPPQLTEAQRRRRVHYPIGSRGHRAASVTASSASSVPTRSFLVSAGRILIVLAGGRRIEVTKKEEASPLIKPWKSFSSLPTWNLIPKEKFTFACNYFLFNFEYKGFTEQYCRLHANQSPFKKSPPTIEHMWSVRQNEVEEKYTLNQKLRWAFKKLFNQWIAKRLQFKNTTDFATMEAPRKEIILYDWSQRCKYRFEASSILADFKTRLLSHEELFPMPMYLRNPFTNLRLSIFQIHSIYCQLKDHGKMHWTLECFRDAFYDIYYFARDNQRKLRLSALKNVLETNECRYILLDFIETQHLLLNKHCDTSLYQWAIGSTKAVTMKRIQSWKEMCYRFYEIDITTEDPDDKVTKQQHLSRMVEPLCTPCEELRMIRQLARNKRRHA